VTNEQLYIAIGVPMLFNAVIALLLSARISDVKTDLKEYMNARFDAVDQRFVSIDQRFVSIDQRFEDLKQLWRTELRRVEEVIDARLKHLEERSR
jgi:hypothetical protein